jgi:hypothetical protein
MHHTDQFVRLAAFRFLEEQTQLAAEDGALRRTLLERGFTYEGQRVPLLGPQGIFKPRILPAGLCLKPAAFDLPAPLQEASALMLYAGRKTGRSRQRP